MRKRFRFNQKMTSFSSASHNPFGSGLELLDTFRNNLYSSLRKVLSKGIKTYVHCKAGMERAPLTVFALSLSGLSKNGLSDYDQYETHFDGF